MSEKPILDLTKLFSPRRGTVEGGGDYRFSLMNELDSSISPNAFMFLFIYLLKFIYLLFD